MGIATFVSRRTPTFDEAMPRGLYRSSQSTLGSAACSVSSSVCSGRHISENAEEVVRLLKPPCTTYAAGMSLHLLSNGSAADRAIRPAPTPGTLELPFLNHILSVEIPLAQQAQYRLPRSSSHLATNIPPPSPASIPVMASLPSSPLSGLLRELISQMWLIWELVILAEPILVYSADTRRASELVQWLTAIVRPLPYGGDYRPFFHM